VNKIIINLGVAADEQSNVMGERFSADDSNKIELYLSVLPSQDGSKGRQTDHQTHLKLNHW